MKVVYVLVIVMFCFGCNSEQVRESNTENLSRNTLIPESEYLSFSSECTGKILSNKLSDQMSAKMYLYKNGMISEEELSQKVFVYFENEPDDHWKRELEKISESFNWEIWTDPSGNNKLGFVTADIPIRKFEDLLCMEIVKKIDTAEDELEPHLSGKLQELNK